MPTPWAIIDHAMGHPFQRTIEPILIDRLQRFPVVAISGARQVGKATLSRSFAGSASRNYLTLDDLHIFDRARHEPGSLVEGTEPLTLDEVQRAPEILRAVKSAVDRDRRNGRFLLTGSANLLLMKNIGDSLAGRASYIVMRPMTEREKSGSKSPPPWTSWIAADDTNGLLTLVAAGRSTPWRPMALAGGFPAAALAASDHDRDLWFESYIDTYVRRDVRDLAQIGDLPAFVRVLKLVALRNGGLLNQAAIALSAQVPRATTQRWIGVLEASYLAHLLPSFAETRSKRVTKSPKLYIADSGLGLYLAGIRNLDEKDGERGGGEWLETLLLNELLVWRESMVPKAEIYFWRTSDGAEVDFVVEHRNRLFPVEVKSTRNPLTADARGIELFCGLHSDQAPFGILLYAGDRPFRLTPHCAAIPLSAVLSPDG